jgi:hypothetical protein
MDLVPLLLCDKRLNGEVVSLPRTSIVCTERPNYAPRCRNERITAVILNELSLLAITAMALLRP